MSVALPGQAPAAEPVRRVRQHVRDGLAVIGFSAAASVACTAALLLLVNLATRAA